jgi:hypothetical protein
MKVQVQRAELVRRIRAAMERERQTYRERAAAYPEQEAAYRAKLARALAREAEKVERGGKLPEGYSRSWSAGRMYAVIVTVGVAAPPKPQPPTLAAHRRMLRHLNLEHRDVLTIDPDERGWSAVL